jgi:hypothetical protein
MGDVIPFPIVVHETAIDDTQAPLSITGEKQRALEILTRCVAGELPCDTEPRYEP